jgi:signal transduction histidine kinase/DNA-binding response OmpR family regulator
MDGKVNILLVDDKPEKLLAIEAVLDDLGQNIVRAYSGREALRAVLQQEFAVILLDVNMPDMDGFETAQLIRQRQSSEHTPIIFVTAFSDDMHVSRGYSLGAVDFITAPIVPDVLRTKVAVFVDLFIKTEQVRRQADALRRRASQLQRLAAASVAIHAAPSLDKLLQAVTDIARDLIGSQQAITLFVPEPAMAAAAAAQRGGSSLPKTQAFSSFSERYATWRQRRLQLDRIATTLVATSRTAVRMTAAELREHPDWEIVRSADIPPIHGGVLAAPLLGRMGRGQNMGVIYVADRDSATGGAGGSSDFTHDDEAILVQLAQVAALAIENTLFAEEREANRIKDEFLATLSHELRTPLNAILGWTQLLRLDPSALAGDALHGVEVIERNAKAQTKLIEDLLDVSRITTGKLRLTMKSISLTAIAKAALDVVRPAADAKSIRLEADLSDDADAIQGDADRLQQVIWNLLSNAVKFTPQHGHVRLSSRLVQESASENGNGHGKHRHDPRIELRVQDDGPGISPDFLPYVFDRFRQADSSSTRSHGGLGIGLTVVRHVVELHGGEVRAESPGEGRGAIFIVRLPRDPAASAASAAAAAPQAGLATTARHRGHRGASTASANGDPSRRLLGVHALIVDDDPDARDMISRVLGMAGARVTQAGSAQEALEQFVRARPDVVISDIAMPDQDGYDLVRQVRQLPAEMGGQTPAIALTAYARDEDRLRALSAGFQMHVVKPVEPPDIIAATAHLVPVGKLAEARALTSATATSTSSPT